MTDNSNEQPAKSLPLAVLSQSTRHKNFSEDSPESANASSIHLKTGSERTLLKQASSLGAAISATSSQPARGQPHIRMRGQEEGC